METFQQDVAAIKATLQQYYFDGIYNGDVSALRKIFHDNALLFGDIKGEPYAKTLVQYLDGVANRVSPKDSGKPYTTDIISVDVINSIAIAKVNVGMYDFNYYDLLSFHKVNGVWLIVNKMLTDVAQA